MLLVTRKRKLWAISVFTLLYLLFSVSVVTLVADSVVDKQVQHKKEVLQQKLALVRYRIEASIFRDTYLADSLATLIAIEPELAVQNWDTVAKQLLSKAQLIRNVSLAPDNVISQVYPHEENEKAIGLDFRTVPNQYATVQKARRNQKVYIAGPLELVQGGQALIARYPIFSDMPHNKEYWGGLSVVLRYGKLLEQSRLHDLEGLEVALVKYEDDGDKIEKVLEGSESITEDYDLNYPVSLPNSRWGLYARYDDLYSTDYVSGFVFLYYLIGGITVSFGYLLALFLFFSYLRTQESSLHDHLTQLPNRRFLFNELNRLMSKKEADIDFTILSIDLNAFKGINDTFGHEAGDELLRHVASKLAKSLRTSDFISRIGGDEFIVILHRTTNSADIEKVIHKLHLIIDTSPLHWNEHTIWTSLSVGYSVYHGKASQLDVEAMLSAADKSMYQDKRSVRNKDVDIC